MRLVLPADPVEVQDPGHLLLARVGERRPRSVGVERLELERVLGRSRGERREIVERRVRR
jgi:hypothetical protein